MKNKFDFYDVVEIVPNEEPDLRELAGQRGTVLGMSQHEETKCWGYSVSLDSSGEVWNVSEEHLIATGESRERGDFYSGESVRVKVDPETSEGSFGAATNNVTEASTDSDVD